jgi:hypothetical protein
MNTLEFLRCGARLGLAPHRRNRPIIHYSSRRREAAEGETDSAQKSIRRHLHREREPIGPKLGVAAPVDEAPELARPRQVDLSPIRLEFGLAPLEAVASNM